MFVVVMGVEKQISKYEAGYRRADLLPHATRLAHLLASKPDYSIV